jgi:hypothetical protein
MDATFSYETSVDFQQTTRRCIHNHGSGDLKSYNTEMQTSGL